MTQEEKPEVKSGVPKNIFAKEPFDSQYGTLYPFHIEFEDGTKGTYSAKKEMQDKFKVGQSVAYEFINGKYPKIKPIAQEKPAFSGKGGYKGKTKAEQVYIISQNTLERAVELAIAGVIENKDIKACAEAYLKFVLEMGEKHVDKVLDK